MFGRQRDVLVHRQQQLVQRSAELRVTLASQVQVLKSPLALADQLRAGLRWLGRHPVWPTAALAVLALWRPRGVLGWASRLVASAQLLLRVWQRLRRTAPRKP